MPQAPSSQVVRALKKAFALGLAVIFLVIIIMAVGALRSAPGGGGGGGASKYELAPDFTLTDITGYEFSLSDYRGKVVILDFFAIHCPACEGQVDELKKVWAKFHDGLYIISISVDPSDTDEALRHYASEHGILWRVARDTAGVGEAYDIRYLPTLVIIDREGYIRHRHEGLTSSDVLIGEVSELLGS